MYTKRNVRVGLPEVQNVWGADTNYKIQSRVKVQPLHYNLYTLNLISDVSYERRFLVHISTARSTAKAQR